MSMGLFKFDNLSIFIGVFIVFFSALAVLYSSGFMRGRKGLIRYYSYLILVMFASLGAVFSNHLILFMVFWGFLGLLLYLLIDFGEKETTARTAKKALIIIGGTDALMLLGLALLFRISGSLRMDDINIAVYSRMSFYAYLCFAAAAFAKAGAMPFHTWVPDASQDSPVPVAAYLPASLDKLLGIYFLYRVTIDIFRASALVNGFLMLAGSVTIIAAVMMALIQHDLKRLLGYHAVSQVGYMVLGLGTGNPIGIAGGLFHMLNHAIYKSCLFFSGGAVEKKAGTTELDKLGGMAKIMPLTFITFLIASFAISGVPPFSGFASKWMVYQGIIESGRQGGRLWVLWLVCAMFGSALTLASFMKLIHAVFLGQQSKELKSRGWVKGEIGPAITIPSVILAGLCVIFGVFAYQVPLKLFIFPSLGSIPAFSGIWDAGLATALIIAAIMLGFMVYLLGQKAKLSRAPMFVGGEVLEYQPDMRVSGTGFYNTIREIGILKFIYGMAEKKMFDIYEVGAKATFGLNGILRYMHNGVLLTYLAWCLLGGAIMLYILLGK
ncbi:MAG: proton-conducting transporter membrane subunit [Candidatus Omnitrophica bacterium]|nr:proton-conducting transporter membrane subunit [Candidatus Omnitrophota bacterium]